MGFEPKTETEYAYKAGFIPDSASFSASSPSVASFHLQNEKGEIPDFLPVVTVSMTNYRYYSPDLGRWLSRDPIEEEGGINLNAAVFNNLLNAIDRLGLTDCCGDEEYDSETECCENDQIVKKTKLWKCYVKMFNKVPINLHIRIQGIGQIRNHFVVHVDFVCNDKDPTGLAGNKTRGCYGKQPDPGWLFPITVIFPVPGQMQADDRVLNDCKEIDTLCPEDCINKISSKPSTWYWLYPPFNCGTPFFEWPSWIDWPWNYF